MSDPRSERTRQLILDTLLNLHRNKKFKDITVRDITRAADINRTTFYRYFTDKYDLYDQTVQQCFEAHLREYVAPDAALNQHTFTRLVYATILFIKDWRGGRVLVNEPSDAIIETRVQAVIFDKIMFWIEPNYMKGPCDSGAEVAATAVSWAMFGVAVRLAAVGGTVSPDEVASELVKMLSGGLWNSLVTFHERAMEA